MDKSIVHVSSHFYSPRLKPWTIKMICQTKPFRIGLIPYITAMKVNKKYAKFGIPFCLVSFYGALFFSKQTIGNDYYLIINAIFSFILLYYTFRAKSKSKEETEGNG